MIPSGFQPKKLNFDHLHENYGVRAVQVSKIAKLFQETLQNTEISSTLDQIVQPMKNANAVAARAMEVARDIAKSDLERAIESKDGPKVLHLLSENKELTKSEFAALCMHLPDIAQRVLSTNPKLAEQMSLRSVHILIHLKNESLLLQLVACGMPVHCIGASFLCAAIDEGLERLVLAMIEKGADIHQTDHRHNTPLHLAVGKGMVDVIDKLLEKGADIYAVRAGDTPLKLAIHKPEILAKFNPYTAAYALEQGNKAKVSELLTKKAALTKKDYAAIWEHAPELACKHLHEVRDLAVACPFSALEALMNEQEHTAIVIKLFESGINLSDYEFLLACRNYPDVMCKVVAAHPILAKKCSSIMLDDLIQCPRCEQLVLTFIDHNLEATSHHILAALRHNLVSVAKKLIARSIPVPCNQDHMKMTALHYAAKLGDLALVRTIVTTKLLFITNSKGQTPRAVAKECEQHEVANYLLCGELKCACNESARDKVIALLAERPRLDGPGFSNLCMIYPDLACPEATPELMWAIPAHVHFIEPQYRELLLRFVELGLDIQMPATDYFKNGLSDVVEKWVDREGQNITKPQADSLLHIAAAYGQISLVKKLLVLGANPLVDDSKGDSAISLAAKGKHLECLSLLFSHLTPSEEEKRIIETNFKQDSTLMLRVLGEAGGVDEELFARLCLQVPLLMLRLLAATPMARICTSNTFGLLLERDAHEELLIKLLDNQSLARHTHLPVAICKNKEALAMRLINIDKHVDTRDSYGMLPLHYAAQIGSGALVKKLLERFSDPLAENSSKLTPRALAEANGHEEVAGLLYEQELKAALQNKDELKVKKLFSEKNALTPERFFTLCYYMPNLAIQYATADLAKGLTCEGLLTLASDAQYDDLLCTLLPWLSHQKEWAHSAFKNGLLKTATKLLDSEIKGLDFADSLLEFVAQNPNGEALAKKLLERGVDPLYSGKATALRHALSAKNSALVALLTEHIPPSMKEQLAKGLDALKTCCKKDVAFVRACCTPTTTPLELPILLNDRAFAVCIMRKLTEEAQLEGIGMLIARYPHSTARILDFFFEVDERHMFKGDLALVTSVIPPVELQDHTYLITRFKSACQPDETFMIEGQKKTVDDVCEAVAYFIKQVQDEEEFSGTLVKGTAEFSEQYAHIRHALSHFCLYLQKADDTDVKAICKHLAQAAYLCFITYRDVAAKLYHNYLVNVAPTGDNGIQLALQQLRMVVAESMASDAGVRVEHSIHAVQYFKRKFGERLQLPDQLIHAQKLSFEESAFNGKLPSDEELLKAFYKRYSPSLLYEHIASALKDEKLRTLYLEWAGVHLKRYAPGREAYKAKKAPLAAKEKEHVLSVLNDADMSPSGLEELRDERRGEINRWLINEETFTANPFPIILTLLTQQVLKIKVSELDRGGA